MSAEFLQQTPRKLTGPRPSRREIPVRGTLVALALSALLAVGPALDAAEGPEAYREAASAQVTGLVRNQSEPVSSAEIYAYDVATYALTKVRSDRRGEFLFHSLPAGLYKIIAHKPGFAPAVELLLRRSNEARQFVELELEEERSGDIRTAEGYWEARGRIPADVLRQIQHVGLQKENRHPALVVGDAAFLDAQVTSQGGTAPVEAGRADAVLTDTAFTLHGRLSEMDVAVDGRLRQLAPQGENAAPDGQVESLALTLSPSRNSQIQFAGAVSQLAEMRPDEMVPVDLEHYQLRWSGTAGGGESDISAQLIDENHYYDSGVQVAEAELPGASRTWNIRGSYRRDVGESTSLTTGVSYRQRESLDPNRLGFDDEVVGLYGVAGSQIQPRVLVEYGLYSSLREGDLTLVPHGGMVVQLGGDWSARTAISQRIDGTEDVLTDHQHRRFNTASYNDDAPCRQAGEACYEVSFARQGEGEESISVGAVHREFAETLKLYFSDDFFNRLENLLIVPGDELPEVKFQMVRRISPQILAKLESNYADGGGGIFYAADELSYENQVRYLVTSLDTRFQSTATGVFIAFHHLEQSMRPQDPQVEGSQGSGLQVQRLQLMLTQDLSALANISPNLAVRLNMELSRGATPYTLTTGDELHKKLTGGISLSF